MQVESKEDIAWGQQTIICCFHSWDRKIQESEWLVHFIRRKCWNKSERLFILNLLRCFWFLSKKKEKEEGLYKMYKCSTSHHIKTMFPVMFYAKSNIFKVVLCVPFEQTFSIAFGFCLLLHLQNIGPRKQKESRNAAE